MGKEKVVSLPGGIRVAIRGPRHQQKWWLRGRFYEAPMLAYIRKHYHGGTFIDGGACIGNHTLFFARFCCDQVIAVEPVVRNMAQLMEAQNVKNQLIIDQQMKVFEQVANQQAAIEQLNRPKTVVRDNNGRIIGVK